MVFTTCSQFLYWLRFCCRNLNAWNYLVNFSTEIFWIDFCWLEGQEKYCSNCFLMSCQRTQHCYVHWTISQKCVHSFYKRSTSLFCLEFLTFSTSARKIFQVLSVTEILPVSRTLCIVINKWILNSLLLKQGYDWKLVHQSAFATTLSNSMASFKFGNQFQRCVYQHQNS